MSVNLRQRIKELVDGIRDQRIPDEVELMMSGANADEVIAHLAELLESRADSTLEAFALMVACRPEGELELFVRVLARIWQIRDMKSKPPFALAICNPGGEQGTDSDEFWFQLWETLDQAKTETMLGLIHWLRSPKAELRHSALLALYLWFDGRRRRAIPAQFIQTILQCLKDQNESIAAQAAWVLAATKSSQAAIPPPPRKTSYFIR